MQTLLRTALLATALGLASPAIAQFGDGGGGGGGGSSDGDWAIRTDLRPDLFARPELGIPARL